MDSIATFINSLKSLDLQSFGKVIEAYLDLYNRPDIEDVGFNTSSGYVYFYLQSGITIASCFGQSVVFIVDHGFNDDLEFETYFEALEFLNNL
jgi:hypothetical protein